MARRETWGLCQLCGKLDKLERHHLIYKPERVIKLCHLCHFKVHYFPNLLTKREIETLLLIRFGGKPYGKPLKTVKDFNKLVDDVARSLSLFGVDMKKAFWGLMFIAPSLRVFRKTGESKAAVAE
jgi:hypothetical protein